MTWLAPELDVGADDGELSPDDDLAADDPVGEWAAADAAPGRLTATAPAAARLAAAAEIVATRSRLRPRSRSAMAGDTPRDGMLCLLMPGVLPPAFGRHSRFALRNL